MKYHIIEPEVIVGIGEKTEFLENRPPYKTVIKLHINLEDWLGDDLMLNSNCYIVTESLKNSLQKSEYSGFEFHDLELTKDEYFDDNYHQDRSLEKFYWMKINGERHMNDLFMNNLELYASERLLNFLQKNFQTKYLRIDPIYDKETDDFILSLIARDKQDSTKNIKEIEKPFRTHEGKNYTQEEWEKYEAEQWKKFKDKE